MLPAAVLADGAAGDHHRAVHGGAPVAGNVDGRTGHPVRDQRGEVLPHAGDLLPRRRQLAPPHTDVGSAVDVDHEARLAGDEGGDGISLHLHPARPCVRLEAAVERCQEERRLVGGQGGTAVRREGGEVGGRIRGPDVEVEDDRTLVEARQSHRPPRGSGERPLLHRHAGRVAADERPWRRSHGGGRGRRGRRRGRLRWSSPWWPRLAAPSMRRRRRTRPGPSRHRRRPRWRRLGARGQRRRHPRARRSGSGSGSGPGRAAGRRR